MPVMVVDEYSLQTLSLLDCLEELKRWQREEYWKRIFEAFIYRGLGNVLVDHDEYRHREGSKIHVAISVEHCR